MRRRLVVSVVILLGAVAPLEADLYMFQGAITDIADGGGWTTGYHVGDSIMYLMLIDFSAPGYYESHYGGRHYVNDTSNGPLIWDYFWADVQHTLMHGPPDYQYNEYHLGGNYYGINGIAGDLQVSDGGFDGYVYIRDNNRQVSTWAVNDVFYHVTEVGYSHPGQSAIESTLTLTGIDIGATGYPTSPVVPVPVPGAALLGVLGLSFAGWRLKRNGAGSSPDRREIIPGVWRLF
jgi:hypothetical protein